MVQQSQIFRDLYQRWQGHQGLITTVLAPSAAQPVTPELMQCISALSAEYDVPIHAHLLETRIQAVTGLEFFGETIIQYAQRHSLLTHRTTIAHSIWLTPKDIERVAVEGATNVMVLGRVLRFHVRQDLYRPEVGLVNTVAMEPITRLGGPREYSKIGELFFLT